MIDFSSENKKTEAETNVQDEVKEADEEILNINSLPDEILIEIFRYLTQEKLGQIAIVCKRWKDLTSSPTLWKTVNVYISCYHHGSQNDIARKLIGKFSSCTTRINLSFKYNYRWTWPLNYEDFSLNLQRVCPNLEELVLQGANLSCNFSSVIHLCAKFLPNIRILHVDMCTFDDCSSEANYDGITKIEVLAIQDCFFYNKPPFSKMPYLRQLHANKIKINLWLNDDTSFLSKLEILNLADSSISSAFRHISNMAFNLIELYLCWSYITDSDLNLHNSTGVFPHLKLICIHGCDSVTMNGVLCLIRSCQSLQKIYLLKEIWRDESYALQPFPNKHKLEIIKTEKYSDCPHC